MRLDAFNTNSLFGVDTTFLRNFYFKSWVKREIVKALANITVSRLLSFL